MGSDEEGDGVILSLRRQPLIASVLSNQRAGNSMEEGPRRICLLIGRQALEFSGLPARMTSRPVDARRLRSDATPVSRRSHAGWEVWVIRLSSIDPKKSRTRAEARNRLVESPPTHPGEHAVDACVVGRLCAWRRPCPRFHDSPVDSSPLA